MSSIQPMSSRSKVLAVDDDEAVLTLLLNVLEGAGYEVSTAQDGAEALRMAQTQPLDLVLTDLVMPNRDGIEVIRSIRKQQPNLRIIAISGAFGGNMLRVAELLGAHATLLKPCSPSHLLAIVHKVLQS
ncbi:MAG: response regulator [Candidatus Korobacteraceae bacterium]|jgi:CheY-like chemotaxis protein